MGWASGSATDSHCTLRFPYGRSVCRKHHALFFLFIASFKELRLESCQGVDSPMYISKVRCLSPSNIIMCLSTCSVDSVTQTACCGSMTKGKTKFTVDHQHHRRAGKTFIPSKESMAKRLPSSS